MECCGRAESSRRVVCVDTRAPEMTSNPVGTLSSVARRFAQPEKKAFIERSAATRYILRGACEASLIKEDGACFFHALGKKSTTFFPEISLADRFCARFFINFTRYGVLSVINNYIGFSIYTRVNVMYLLRFNQSLLSFCLNGRVDGLVWERFLQEMGCCIRQFFFNYF